jgi:small subunit ribosomal protein S20
VTELPAAKSDRVAKRKYERNRPLSSRAKTFVKSARRHIASGDLEAADQAVKGAATALDKAAAKGALHPNNAARRKSRIMSQLAQAKNS